MNKKLNNTLVLALIIISIISDSGGDAAMDINDKVLGHVLASLSILGLLLIPAIYESKTTGHWLWFLIGYIFMRFAIFDLTYNLYNPNVSWDYIGSTSLYDKVMSLWGGGALLFARIIAGIGGVSILIRKI